MTDHQYLMQRVVWLLEESMVYFERKAADERRREEGKSLRQITAQERLKGARETLAEVRATLSAEVEG